MTWWSPQYPMLDQGFVDWDWLAKQPAVSETEFVRHVRLTVPATARLDGRRRQGALYKR